MEEDSTGPILYFLSHPMHICRYTRNGNTSYHPHSWNRRPCCALVHSDPERANGVSRSHNDTSILFQNIVIHIPSLPRDHFDKWWRRWVPRFLPYIFLQRHCCGMEEQAGRSGPHACKCRHSLCGDCKGQEDVCTDQWK